MLAVEENIEGVRDCENPPGGTSRGLDDPLLYPQDIIDGRSFPEQNANPFEGSDERNRNSSDYGIQVGGVEKGWMLLPR